MTKLLQNITLDDAKQLADNYRVEINSLDIAIEGLQKHLNDLVRKREWRVKLAYFWNDVIGEIQNGS